MNTHNKNYTIENNSKNNDNVEIIKNKNNLLVKPLEEPISEDLKVCNQNFGDSLNFNELNKEELIMI